MKAKQYVKATRLAPIMRGGLRLDRWRKLEIPIFEGEDVYGWTTRVERYFNLKGMSCEKKLQAVMAIERNKVTWYQW